MKKKVIITADSNDGDYISEISDIDEREELACINMAKAIKEFEPYKSQKTKEVFRNNFPIGECCSQHQKDAQEYYVEGEKVSEEDFDLFYELIPFNQYGIHTITDIIILEVSNEEKIL